jgi:hypothetical protein
MIDTGSIEAICARRVALHAAMTGLDPDQVLRAARFNYRLREFAMVEARRRQEQELQNAIRHATEEPVAA